MNPILTYLPYVAFGLGAALIVHAALVSVANLGGALQLRRNYRRLRLENTLSAPRRQPLSAERAAELLQPPVFSPVIYMVAACLSGLGIVFTGNLFAVLPLVLVFAARLYLDHEHRVRMEGETYDFILRLRMQLSLKGALLPALKELADEGSSAAARVVGIFLGTGEMDGLRVLQRAADAGVPYLKDLAARAAITRAASLSMDEALGKAIDDLREEQEAKMAERIESGPGRMILIAFPILLGPALVMVLYPVVTSLLAMLSAPAAMP